MSSPYSHTTESIESVRTTKGLHPLRHEASRVMVDVNGETREEVMTEDTVLACGCLTLAADQKLVLCDYCSRPICGERHRARCAASGCAFSLCPAHSISVDVGPSGETAVFCPACADIAAREWRWRTLLSFLIRPWVHVCE